MVPGELVNSTSLFDLLLAESVLLLLVFQEGGQLLPLLGHNLLLELLFISSCRLRLEDVRERKAEPDRNELVHLIFPAAVLGPSLRTFFFQGAEDSPSWRNQILL